MFNNLQLSFATKSVLRCRQCKSILFAQDHIAEFMQYDPKDLGKLEGYSDHKKFEGEACFFLLTDSYDTFSSFKIDYTDQSRLEYHPFFMMNMFLIKCGMCGQQLGYQVVTVNENTLWMERRSIIDVSKCLIFKDGKDQMARAIKICKSRLRQRLESVKIQEKQPEQDMKIKIFQKLQKVMLHSRKARKTSNKHKDEPSRDKVSQDLKKRGISVQSTRGPTSSLNLSDEKSQTLNYTAHETIFKSAENSYGFQEQSLRQNHLTESFFSLSVQKANVKQVNFQFLKNQAVKNLSPIQLPYQTREKLTLSLQLWTQRIIADCKNQAVFPIIKKIEEHLWKLDFYEKQMMGKLVEQHIKMEKMKAIVRQTMLEEKDDEEI